MKIWQIVIAEVIIIVFLIRWMVHCLEYMDEKKANSGSSSNVTVDKPMMEERKIS